MGIVNELDRAIKLFEKKTTEGAYVVPHNGGQFHKETYMTNEEWNDFLASMPETTRKEYGEGGGDELSEKNGRPPKMASYGSSSRMIYMYSRHKSDFHYEKKLSTTIGGKANLDGFYEDEGRYVFVEAKCHEPYTVKKNVVSECYAKLYEYINERMMGQIQIEMNPSNKEHYMDVEYFAGGEKLEHFDLKQMICHLLGVATGILKKTLEKKQMDFIYLLYDPTELEFPPKAKAEIDAIYGRTCYECNLVDFVELFRVILDLLRETKYADVMSDDEVDKMVCKFTFTLTNQEFYPTLIQ